jgi:hypothetical protein
LKEISKNKEKYEKLKNDVKRHVGAQVPNGLRTQVGRSLLRKHRRAIKVKIRTHMAPEDEAGFECLLMNLHHGSASGRIYNMACDVGDTPDIMQNLASCQAVGLIGSYFYYASKSKELEEYFSGKVVPDLVSRDALLTDYEDQYEIVQIETLQAKRLPLVLMDVRYDEKCVRNRPDEEPGFQESVNQIMSCINAAVEQTRAKVKELTEQGKPWRVGQPWATIKAREMRRCRPGSKVLHIKCELCGHHNVSPLREWFGKWCLGNMYMYKGPIQLNEILIWRLACSVCMSILIARNVEIANEKLIPALIKSDVKIIFKTNCNMYVACMGQLDRLKKMRYSDFYDDMTPENKEILIKNDLRVYSKFYAAMMSCVSVIPSNISPSEKDIVGRTYPMAVFAGRSYACCSDTLVKTMMQVQLDVYTRSLGNTETLSYWYNNHGVETLPGVKVLTIKEHLSLPKLYDCLINYNNEIILIQVVNPRPTIVGVEVCNHEGMLVYGMTESTQTYSVSNDMLDLLENHNGLLYNSNYYKLEKVDSNGLSTLYYLCASDCEVGAVEYEVNKNDLVQLKMPMPISLIDGLNQTGIGLLAMKEFLLDPKLLRTLCIMCLKGVTNVKQLMEYAVGYALRRFIVSKRHMILCDVSPEDLECHVAAAMLLANQYHNEYRLNVNTAYGVKGLVGSIMNQVLTRQTIDLITCYTTYGDQVKMVVQAAEEYLKQSDDLNASIEKLRDVLELSIKPLVKTKSLYIIGSSRPMKIMRSSLCQHHKIDCDHPMLNVGLKCVCCDVSIAVGLYCVCCGKSSNKPEVEILPKPKEEVKINLTKLPKLQHYDDQGEEYNGRHKEIDHQGHN